MFIKDPTWGFGRPSIVLTPAWRINPMTEVPGLAPAHTPTLSGRRSAACRSQTLSQAPIALPPPPLQIHKCASPSIGKHCPPTTHEVIQPGMTSALLRCRPVPHLRGGTRGNDQIKLCMSVVQTWGRRMLDSEKASLNHSAACRRPMAPETEGERCGL